MTDTTQHTAAIRRQLAGLAGLRAQSGATEKAIQSAAGKRLEVVEADLAALKPRVFLDDGAAKRYEALMLERGRLGRMLTAG